MDTLEIRFKSFFDDASEREMDSAFLDVEESISEGHVDGGFGEVMTLGTIAGV